MTKGQSEALVAQALEQARSKGADHAEVEIRDGLSLSVSSRAGRVDNIDYTQDLQADIQVYVGQRTGTASCTSADSQDISLAIDRALTISKNMQEDDCEGLPDAEDLADGKEDGGLELYMPWRPSIDAMVSLAQEAAEASWAVDPRISKEKSDGVSVSTTESRRTLGNTLGFLGVEEESRHGISCTVIADLAHGMESNGWADDKVAFEDLDSHIDIARTAAERAVARDGPRPLESAQVPVLLERGVAHSLVRNFLGTLYGSRVYRKLSCFKEAVGEQLLPKEFSLIEDPFIPRGGGSALFDQEGVKTAKKKIVDEGVLRTFLLSSYSARKLKTRTTGNAGGVTNLVVDYPERPAADLLKEMGRGLLVTGMMGGGANPVTGDFSAGAYGFWVEGGQIAFPVKDATVAGTLQGILAGIVAGGDDRKVFGNTDCGSLLLGELAVGGSKAG